MTFIYRSIILLGFIYLHTAMTCNAQTESSIASPADYSLLPFRHIGLQTSNPVAYFGVEDNRMNGEIIYNHASGDYKYISDPVAMNGGGIALEGFKRVNKLHFYGSFSYNIAGLKGQKWKNALMTSEGNPFILADSVGGSYDNETFEIKGAVASSFNEKMKWGIVADYKGGSSADQSDPRPRIDATRYYISPGIMYNLYSWDLGLNLSYEGYREDISITLLETNIDARFFRFQGLGNHLPDSGISYSRQYKGSTFGGNVQAGYKKSIFENIIQLGYNSKTENSEDGSGSTFKSGDYGETNYSLKNILLVKRGLISHVIKLNINHSPSKGIWYDQKEVTNSNNEKVWEIYNKSVKYKDNTTKAGLEYVCLKEKEGFKDYTFGGSIELEQHKTTYLPEAYLQKYSNIKTSLKGSKTFWLPRRFNLNLGLGASYRKNLSSEAYFDGIALANIWTYPVFEYLTSDYYAGSVSVKVNKQTLLGSLPSIIYATANINYAQSTLKSDNFDKPHRIEVAASVGFTF